MTSTLPLTLPEFAERAAEVLPDGVLRYFAGAAGDEITLADNVVAWQRLALRQRVLVDVSKRDLSVEILGVRRPHPVIMAPMAWQTLANPGGEIAAAQGIGAAGGIYTMSCWASQHADDVAAQAADTTRWMHIHIFPDRDITQRLVDRAVRGGFEALVLTADQPVAGRRDRSMRAQFARPGSPNLADLAPGSLEPAQTWEDVAELVTSSPLPVIVKGLLEPGDAELAIQAGAAGIVVSNHGARQLDTVLSTASALPAVVEQVAGRVDVLVDGGIRRGSDIVKALALGADAVLIGRPLLWGLAVGGADGVRHSVELYLKELDIALAVLGVTSAAELEPSIVLPAPWSA
ncbi:alpha-hydroxy acid oxidase [Amycolatopsis pithecellobii]|uniref:Alpha-hydroxy-acid oxidizing protein n=1 Tax=Amycolatopsis pithecellobii TaxID=664692 RepID=A0A6N7Z902_9PSEU|nr:alpha-hydroxy acid oxidase [Amycolatopsis pithecellobii]MTD57586.1 alpha-hydroxy-acid oxidizing protein [Amycolatopsis pithecellobii]